MAKRSQKSRTEIRFPTREDILSFVARNPGRTGKREIARAFAVKGDDRIAMKRLLRDMQDEGLLQRTGKRLRRAGELPPVTVLAITARDSDGELLAVPLKWDADEHGEPPQVLITSRGSGRAGSAPGIGDHVLARLGERPADHAAAYTGKVIKIIDRQPREILGIFRRTENGGRIEPVDRKQKELAVGGPIDKTVADGDLVEVEVTRTGRYGHGVAHIRTRIGSMKSEKAVSMIAIHAHRLPHRFPEAALKEAKAARPVALGGREDWRELPLITIDPADAKDHDDAVFAEADPSPDNPDGWVVTVAIADVAAYVRPGSAMDREAQLRGNSVYFPDHVIPMLPERISNDLCSLKAGRDRPALAVRMVFDKTGRKRTHRFHRILMNAAAGVSYEQAQAAVEGRPDEITAPLRDAVLEPLFGAYACLKRGRDNRQPLDLDLPERKILLDAKGRVERIVVPPRLESHRLIEEFMIQANVCAAETLEEKRAPVLYRVHDTPSDTKLEGLREFLRTISIKLPKSGPVRPAQFNRILASVAASDHSHLVSEVILRAQAQAEYDPVNIGHFGLNLRRYAHFTSPIRRYADLIVHRSLIRALSLGDDGLPGGAEDTLAAIAAEISAAERRAMAAERDTVDRLMALWLAERVGAEFTGRIAGVTRAGLFVKLDDIGADGFVPISTIGDDYYRYDSDTFSVTGERSGETYRLGDAVSVRLMEVAPFAGAMRFELLSEGRRQKPSGDKSGRRSGRRTKTRRR